MSGSVNTKIQRPGRGINPHRMESKCGFQEHGPSDLFSGSFDEPAKQLQPVGFTPLLTIQKWKEEAEVKP